MIEAGKYRARAVNSALGLSGNGSEQIGILWRVTEGTESDTCVQWRGYFTESTTARTIESLRYAGWTGNDLSAFIEADEIELQSLLPDEVEIVVEAKEGIDEFGKPNGKFYPEVRWVNRLGSGTVSMKNKMDSNSARAFAERMRGACCAIPVSAGAKQKKPAASSAVRPAQQRPPASRAPSPPPGRFDDDEAEDFPRL